MESRKAIGKRIKIARIEADKSQEWMAEQFNVTQKTISAWEMGRNPIESARLREIAQVLDKPIEFFFIPFDSPAASPYLEHEKPDKRGAGARGKPAPSHQKAGKRSAA